ncbi:MAG: N-acetylmuramoyl-L-alanine amidase [Bacteroidota bacterium]|nr:N-acetylmuramoyl-L-alanine amidase [Bacteroidota bacterium]
MYRSILFTLMCFSAISVWAQNSIPIQFPQTPSRNTNIGAFPKNNVLYCSLNDFAQILKLKTYINSESKKFEFRTDEFTLKFTANNPFVVIVDKKENANLLQMSANVIFAANSFFIPTTEFISILKTVIVEEISFDGYRITIGSTPAKSTFDVTNLSFEEKSNGLLVHIHSTKKINDYECWPKQIGNDTWFYITLANTRADINTIKSIKPTGIVKQILAFQYPTSVQLTLRLKGQINAAEPMIGENGKDILIAIQTATKEQAEARKTRNYERELQRERDKWKLDVVVIDAGHGGDDPGAIGVTGTREKDITLSIALKLGKLIEKNLPGVNVVYTRKTDTFVELYRRGQIANQNGGKLFISIHCNSMPGKNRTENGFEIYLLRPGKTESALRIAERENEVVKFEPDFEKRYQKLTEENFILLTMAQSAYVKYSEQFAEILTQEMGKHLDLSNKGVKQAGFYVLVGASMPNVLVETAYLSNKHDEKILKSVKGQQRMAEAIFNGVKRFKQEYEKTLSEGRSSGSE